MPVPSRTGSIAMLQSTSQNDSDSVTVPADADLAIVVAAVYVFEGVNFSSLTLGGNGLTEINAFQNVGAEAGDTVMWRLTNPPSGSQTLAWGWEAEPEEGATIFVVFYKDVNTSSPITDSDVGYGDPTATSAAFSSSTNDTCLCVGYSFDATDCDAGYGANQVEIADGDIFGGCQGAVGEKAGVSGTTTMEVDGDYCSIVACSIAGSVGGIPVPAVAAHQYRRRRT